MQTAVEFTGQGLKLGLGCLGFRVSGAQHILLSVKDLEGFRPGFFGVVDFRHMTHEATCRYFTLPIFAMG